jgi:tetratricopeptide (TPR) repeat protein
MVGSIAHHVIATESGRPLPSKPEPGHYTLRAFVLLSMQRSTVRTKAAHALIEKALELDSDWIPALLTYSWALVNEFYGRDAESFGKAERAIDHAIKLAPGNAAAYERRAAVLRARGDWEGAIAASQRAVALNPNLANAHAELGRGKLGVGQTGEATAHIEEAIQLAPTHSSAHLWWWWIGQACVQAGDYAGAVPALERARRGNPANANPVPWLAIAYAGAGREEEGRAVLAEHSAKTPGFTASDWIARNTPHNAVAAGRFAPTAEIMRRLAGRDGAAKVGSRE